MSEVTKKLFSREIQSNLFPDNAFYKYSKLDGGVNPDVTEIEIPNAGAAPTVVKNPTQFPLQASERVDTKKTYSTTYLATTPTVLRDVNQLMLSYDKRADILKDHSSALNTEAADIIAYAWGSGALTKRATTEATASRPASAPSATGNRKKVLKADIQYFQEQFDKLDVPVEGRYAVLPAEMYADVAAIDDFINFEKIGLTNMIARGVVGQIYGFNIMKRSRVLYTESNGTVRPLGNAGATSDSLAGIFWHESFVRRAEGNVRVYINEGEATFHGSVMSAGLVVGGTPGYTNGKGVGILYQGT